MMIKTARRHCLLIAHILAAFWFMLQSPTAFTQALSEPAAPPARVVSVNLCTDLYLLSLADPEQISSLTFLASNPEESLLAEQASQYPTNLGTTEDVLRHNPDLVLAQTYTDPFLLTQLARLDIPVVKIDHVQSIAQLEANYQKVAQALGHVERAEQQLANFSATLQRHTVENDQPPLIYSDFSVGAYLSPMASLKSEVLGKLGLKPLNQSEEVANIGFVGVEALLRYPPDVIFADRYYEDAPSLRAAMNTHPALETVRAQSLVIKENKPYWRCFTPELGAHIGRIAEQVKAYRASSNRIDGHLSE